MRLVATASDEQAAQAAVDFGFETFSRSQWAAFGRQRGRPLSPSNLRELVALGQPTSTDEIIDIYRPLSQLVGVLATAKRQTRQQISTFLGEDRPAAPFVVGIAGSVAVGKSTTARLLQALLRRSPGRPTVDLLTTDGFLYPNAVLEARGLMERKGFPESYDLRHLVAVLAAIRAGQPDVATPVYSHSAYDIIPGELDVLRQPAILIVEGLNVLQVNTKGVSPDQVVVSDFFDFSIYVDAREEDIARWFGERLLALRATALQEPNSFAHRLASMPAEEVAAIARRVWSEINLVNLRENVAPTRTRAHLILAKDSGHRVSSVLLRRS